MLMTWSRGGESLDEVKTIKEAIELFKKGGFSLHKWNSMYHV